MACYKSYFQNYFHCPASLLHSSTTNPSLGFHYENWNEWQVSSKFDDWEWRVSPLAFPSYRKMWLLAQTWGGFLTGLARRGWWGPGKPSGRSDPACSQRGKAFVGSKGLGEKRLRVAGFGDCFPISPVPGSRYQPSLGSISDLYLDTPPNAFLQDTREGKTVNGDSWYITELQCASS